MFGMLALSSAFQLFNVGLCVNKQFSYFNLHADSREFISELRAYSHLYLFSLGRILERQIKVTE